jgi:hypothetical protein
MSSAINASRSALWRQWRDGEPTVADIPADGQVPVDGHEEVVWGKHRRLLTGEVVRAVSVGVGTSGLVIIPPHLCACGGAAQRVAEWPVASGDVEGDANSEGSFGLRHVGSVCGH